MVLRFLGVSSMFKILSRMGWSTRGGTISFWRCGEVPLKLAFLSVYDLARRKDALVCDKLVRDGAFLEPDGTE